MSQFAHHILTNNRRRSLCILAPHSILVLISCPTPSWLRGKSWSDVRISTWGTTQSRIPLPNSGEGGRFAVLRSRYDDYCSMSRLPTNTPRVWACWLTPCCLGPSSGAGFDKSLDYCGTIESGETRVGPHEECARDRSMRSYVERSNQSSRHPARSGHNDQCRL